MGRAERTLLSYLLDSRLLNQGAFRRRLIGFLFNSVRGEREKKDRPCCVVKSILFISKEEKFQRSRRVEIKKKNVLDCVLLPIACVHPHVVRTSRCVLQLLCYSSVCEKEIQSTFDVVNLSCKCFWYTNMVKELDAKEISTIINVFTTYYSVWKANCIPFFRP